ncbi:MAG: hypothetical protein CMD74_02695 [Gammaproteobacteria bacterium]|nr:hypothetical protein [Gammaproteobacteria bacterium]
MVRQKIDKILSNNPKSFGQLSRLIRRSNELSDWTAHLRSILPEALQSECSVSDLSQDTITISCDTASTGTRLRFMVPEVLGKLAVLSDFSSIEKIKIIVRRR